MRAPRTFLQRPVTLLALGAALVASVPACSCGVGLVLVPFVGGALLRIALDAARAARDPASRGPLPMRPDAVGLWLALPVLAATAAGGSCAALETTLGRSLVARAVSPFPAVAAVAVLVVAAALSGPFALAACASTSGARGARSALDAVHARRGLPLSRSVVASCAALPVLLTAPWAVFIESGSATLTVLLAVLAAIGTPLLFCEIAATWAAADEPPRLVPTPADDTASPTPTRRDRALVVARAAFVLAAVTLVLAALLTPAQVMPMKGDGAPLGGPRRTFDTSFTLPGTTVRIARDGDALDVSVTDGGGAGRLPGVHRARAFRVASRPEVCRSCVELELSGDQAARRTLLDAAGVRHDDGAAARLASAGGLPGSLALVFAAIGTLALAHRARRHGAASFAVVAAWSAAVLALVHGVLR